MDEKRLQSLREELRHILEKNILQYWSEHAIDEKYGGFAGHIDGKNRKHEKSNKGSILNTRILWTFSAAYRSLNRPDYLELADRAYKYLMNHFWDPEYGGIYWELDFKGNPVNKRKQIYALAFAIYALCEYHRAKKVAEPLEKAKEIYRHIEKYAFDKKKNGYIEAFGESWEPLEDVRLSEKDANEKKTMNTHLHLLEAYTQLVRFWPEEKPREALKNLIFIMLKWIIDSRHYHFHLFFDENWVRKSNHVSFGHDIEGSWLLDEAAGIYGDPALVQEVRKYSIRLVQAAIEGIDNDGGLMNEKDLDTGHMDTDKHWWPQAEALVGFFNSYQITKDESYLQYCFRMWDFIQDFIIDHENGEWYWKVDQEGKPYLEDEKIGFWKCPYHNSRACMEMIERIDQVLNKK